MSAQARLMTQNRAPMRAAATKATNPTSHRGDSSTTQRWRSGGQKVGRAGAVRRHMEAQEATETTDKNYKIKSTIRVFIEP